MGTRALRYAHPSEMEQVPNEVLYGIVTHYTHRRVPRGPVRARLGRPGRRFSITVMGACLWRRNDRSLLVLRLPIYGDGSVWQVIP